MEAINNQDGICVAIRIRPLSEHETTNGHGVAFQSIPKYNQIGQLKDGQLMKGQTFDFDKVFDEQSTTNQIYTASARNLVMNVMNGINGTIFACKYLRRHNSSYLFFLVSNTLMVLGYCKNLCPTIYLSLSDSLSLSRTHSHSFKWSD